MTNITYSILTGLIGTLALVTPAAAQTLTGSASVSGNIVINATGVFFNNTGANTAANPLTPGSSNTGSFAGLTSGAIKNLPGMIAPGPLMIKNFASFNTPSATIVFDLQSIAPGSGTSGGCTTNAIGTVCTPPGSPLTLIQITPNAISISLTLNGIAYPTTAGSAGTAASLTCSANVVGYVPSVLPTIVTAAGLHGSHSCTLTVTAP